MNKILIYNTMDWFFSLHFLLMLLFILNHGHVNTKHKFHNKVIFCDNFPSIEISEALCSGWTVLMRGFNTRLNISHAGVARGKYNT